uniref:gas vesicle protein GvpN n=1 Tax=Bradyrhizobium sp. (strain ORS 278) TaxID=114615 RepID=UPI00030DCDFB|nr:gas vesicle protein GvpN [Bradyrhizobium sp. ORS 278]
MVQIEKLEGEHAGVVKLHARSSLFLDDGLRSLKERSLRYLRAGAPIHFRGPAGTGKTTLAMAVAAEWGRPVCMIVGDSAATSASLIGEQTGVRTKQIVDRYVSSVRRVETETGIVWTDNALTTAIMSGYTLIYDEFTRSPPQANNPLLMALEERMVIISGRARADRYEAAHPEFRVILTSNPEDYAGISQPQDALIDRVITFDFDHHRRDAEIGIVMARSGASFHLAEVAVDIVRAVRQSKRLLQLPSIRSAIIIARVAHNEDFVPDVDDPHFMQLCFDVLEAKAPSRSMDPEQREGFQRELSDIIEQVCRSTPSEGDQSCSG